MILTSKLRHFIHQVSYWYIEQVNSRHELITRKFKLMPVILLFCNYGHNYLFVLAESVPSCAGYLYVRRKSSQRSYYGKTHHAVAKLSTFSLLGSVTIQETISRFQSFFNDLKKTCREELQTSELTTKLFVDTLKQMPADEMGHEQFQENFLSVLYQSSDFSELMGKLGFNMHYLSYQLMDFFGEKFDLNNVKEQMNHYEQELRNFRENTRLSLYCQTHNRKIIRLSPDFQEIVIRVKWQDDVVLEYVELFRREYSSHYKLHDYAMMFAHACESHGGTSVTWFIPNSITAALKEKNNLPKKILNRYYVNELKVAGESVRHVEFKVSLTFFTIVFNRNLLKVPQSETVTPKNTSETSLVTEITITEYVTNPIVY